MFATVRGTVRRNKLSDFQRVNVNGKIAMKLEDGDGIVGVDTCSPDDDVMLTTAAGQAIRFRSEDVRLFAGRNSVGVRGVRLGATDRVISMAILRGSQATPAERVAYMRLASAARRAMQGDDGEEVWPMTRKKLLSIPVFRQSVMPRWVRWNSSC